jgi:hypothetical protein
MDLIKQRVPSGVAAIIGEYLMPSKREMKSAYDAVVDSLCMYTLYANYCNVFTMGEFGIRELMEGFNVSFGPRKRRRL